MKLICANFGCENEANTPFVCCDQDCGYEHNGHKQYLKNYQHGEKWNEPFRSLGKWSIEKLEYYSNLIKGQ